MPNYSLKACVLRIKQRNGLDFSTALPTSPRRLPILSYPFFMKFRGPQALSNREDIRHWITRATGSAGLDGGVSTAKARSRCPCLSLLVRSLKIEASEPVAPSVVRRFDTAD